MWSNLPDDEIADTVEVSTAAQLRACADPLRMTLLDLVPFGRHRNPRNPRILAIVISEINHKQCYDRFRRRHPGLHPHRIGHDAVPAHAGPQRTEDGRSQTKGTDHGDDDVSSTGPRAPGSILGTDLT